MTETQLPLLRELLESLEAEGSSPAIAARIRKDGVTHAKSGGHASSCAVAEWLKAKGIAGPLVTGRHVHLSAEWNNDPDSFARDDTTASVPTVVREFIRAFDSEEIAL